MRDLFKALLKPFNVAWGLLIDELISLNIAIFGAWLPAVILSYTHFPSPYFPEWSFMEWMKAQILVYFVLRIFFVQRKAAR